MAVITPQIRGKIFKQLRGPVTKIFNETMNKDTLEQDHERGLKITRDVADCMETFLTEQLPDIPVIVAEELVEEKKEKIAKNNIYWELDPVDGTNAFKEYHKSVYSGAELLSPDKAEVSVLLSLIQDGAPVFGAIWLPFAKTLYSIDDQGRAFRQKGNGRAIELNPSRSQENPVIVMSSEEYGNDPILPGELKDCKIKRSAHIFKFLDLLEGRADLALLGTSGAQSKGFKTHDISAIDAILRPCGFLCVSNGQVLTYKEEDNPDFVLPEFQIGKSELLTRLGYTPDQSADVSRSR